MTRPSEYDIDVNEWLESKGITFTIERIGSERGFQNEKPRDNKPLLMHDTYSAQFVRNGPSGSKRLYVPKFYQSAAHSESALKETKCSDACGYQYGETMVHHRRCNANPANARVPSAYDILSCLTKDDPRTFEEFCSEYGYDNDSRSAERTYFAVQEEWTKVQRFFTGEELDELRRIAQ